MPYKQMTLPDTLCASPTRPNTCMHRRAASEPYSPQHGTSTPQQGASRSPQGASRSPPQGKGPRASIEAEQAIQRRLSEEYSKFELGVAELKSAAEKGSPQAWKRLAPPGWISFDSNPAGQPPRHGSAPIGMPGSWTSKELESLNETVQLAKGTSRQPELSQPASAQQSTLRRCALCPDAVLVPSSHLQRCPACREYYHVRCFLAHSSGNGTCNRRSSPKQNAPQTGPA